jgi:AcrR family transcriptional regulator
MAEREDRELESHLARELSTHEAIVWVGPTKLQHVLGSGYGSAVAAATSRTGTRAAETAARKQRLIDAATGLAAEGGYDAVQMRDVAGRAEVALGTLYRHYASKDQLLLAALAAQAVTLRERLDQRPPRGDAPADRVADVLRRASRALERQPRVTHAMLTAMSVSDDSATAIKHEVTETLRAIIVDAVDSTPVPDLDDVVRVLGSVWFAELTFWSGGLTDATAMADHLARAAALVLGNR